QPRAIEQLVNGIKQGMPQQMLLGVTGSGKTFTMANVIAKLQRPTLVLSHNKTLAAQLYEEFLDFFPENKVCYFVSYFDYYQPESYLPASDTYIEKDSQVNEKIERLRLEAGISLLTRRDVIIVSSVSCIYGFGSPAEFQAQSLEVKAGEEMPLRQLLLKLVALQYERNDTELKPGRFRVRGDTIDIVQGGGTTVIRLEYFGDQIEHIYDLHPLTLRKEKELRSVWLYPARAYVTNDEHKKLALKSIRQELEERLPQLKDPVFKYRLRQRTNYDLEMIEQLGYCKGIENYSRHFDRRAPGSPPYTLLHFMPPEWLLFIDESHASLPQLRGMYEGDRSRKRNLIDYGFRLPSAYDNRPLRFDEFTDFLKPFNKTGSNVVYVSATPAQAEISNSSQIVEQIIRPTGLVDPPIAVRPSAGQIEDLMAEINKTVRRGNRALVTTLTKRMAEELASYLLRQDFKVEYLHSEIDTLERVEVIKRLRSGKIDVIVGINLLREGLDLPEVGLVAILDADKEGFLRNERSLIQTVGRAARNIDSQVIFYADKTTVSMKLAIQETERRRKIQLAYNQEHGITPQSIKKQLKITNYELRNEEKSAGEDLGEEDIFILEEEMRAAAEELDFERAIELRERIKILKIVP
ncbi:excinuclease ABC subunit B, partial [Candidatus Falkowbacteria bacterium RIFCSPHIGHO2_02_FULL_45_15]